MSLPRGESVDKNINPSSHSNQHPQTQTEATVLSSSSSLAKNHNDNKTTLDKGKLEESDEDLFRVPDVTVVNNNVNAKIYNNKAEAEIGGKRRRGQNPVDKEYRRLKRLLRNRVSAQQARERKKVYVSDMESKAKELQDINSRLEEKISTLINQNTMLRKVLMNTRPKADEHASKERIVGQELTS